MDNERDDNPGSAPAPADAGAPAAGAKWSEVDLSDLDKLQADEAANAERTARGDDEDESEADSTDDDEVADGDEDSDEEDDEADGESDDDAEDGDDESDDEGERPRKRNRSQRYQDTIRRQQEEIAQLRGRQSAGRLTDDQVEARVRAIIGDPPKEEDFPGDYLAFDRAAAAYELDKRQTVRQVKADAANTAAADNARNVERVERHRENVEAFRNRGKTPDEKKANAKAFDQAMAEARTSGVKVAPHVEDLILDSKKSGHLTLYFAKNPEKLEQLNRMSEREAARAIGGIESRLSVPKPRTKTSAPPPRKTPRGGAQQPSEMADLNAFLSKEYGPNRR